MSVSASQFTIAKPASGLLPISAVSSQTNVALDATQRDAASRGANLRLKVLVRRLAPGLTEDEFETALGEEWKCGNGKINWIVFRPGKVSKDLAKPSRPARAYLHVTEQVDLGAISEKINQTSFIDARNTSTDVVLLGPPQLEVATYGRVPNGKSRIDARQGLIDQDPDFVEFLESLTNPITKGTTANGVAAVTTNKENVVTVTPLIQHLRDKKAAKDKALPNKIPKHSRQGSKADSEVKPEEKTTFQPSKSALCAGQKANGSTILLKIPEKDVSITTKSEAALALVKSTPVMTPLSDKPRPISKSLSPATAAARIIQRDLGLKGRGGISRRFGNRLSDASPSSVNTNTTQAGRSAAHPSSATTSTDKVPSQALPINPPTAPAAILRRAEAAKQKYHTHASAPSPTAMKPPPVPVVHSKNISAQSSGSIADPPHGSPTSTQAFLKHANPSQGITEPLIAQALLPFGTTTKVEIDKRKGFAYVDFAEPAGLRKAIAAGSIKVAQGSVQVLERKDRPAVRGVSHVRGSGVGGMGGVPFAPPFRGARGGRGRGSVARGAEHVTLAIAENGSSITAAPALTAAPAPPTLTSGSSMADGA